MLYPAELRARPFSDCTPQNPAQKSLVRERSQLAFVFASPFPMSGFSQVLQQTQLPVRLKETIRFTRQSALRRRQLLRRFLNPGARRFNMA